MCVFLLPLGLRCWLCPSAAALLRESAVHRIADALASFLRWPAQASIGRLQAELKAARELKDPSAAAAAAKPFAGRAAAEADAFLRTYLGKLHREPIDMAAALQADPGEWLERECLPAASSRAALLARFCTTFAAVDDLDPAKLGRPLGPAEEEERARRLRHAALATAHLLQARNETFRWPYGYLVQFVLRTATMSPAAVNMVKRLVPGTIGDSGLSRWLQRLVNAVKEANASVVKATNVLVQYNNVGIYRFKSSRGSRLKTVVNSILGRVWTAIELFHLRLRDPITGQVLDVGEAELIQRDHNLAPWKWLPMRPHSEFTPEGFEKLDSKARNGEVASDTECLASQQLGYAEDALAALKALLGVDDGEKLLAGTVKTVTADAMRKKARDGSVYGCWFVVSRV